MRRPRRPEVFIHPRVARAVLRPPRRVDRRARGTRDRQRMTLRRVLQPVGAIRQPGLLVSFVLVVIFLFDLVGHGPLVARGLRLFVLEFKVCLVVPLVAVIGGRLLSHELRPVVHRGVDVEAGIVRVSDVLLPQDHGLPEPSEIAVDLDKEIKDVESIHRSAKDGGLSLWCSVGRYKFFPRICIEIEEAKEEHFNRDDE